jgi:hypothetical protein
MTKALANFCEQKKQKQIKPQIRVFIGQARIEGKKLEVGTKSDNDI